MNQILTSGDCHSGKLFKNFPSVPTATDEKGLPHLYYASFNIMLICFKQKHAQNNNES